MTQSLKTGRPRGWVAALCVAVPFVSVAGFGCASSTTTSDATRVADRLRDAAPAQPSTDAERTKWIRERAVSLDDRTRLRAELATIVGEARLVGIGEATHGSGNVFLARGQLTIDLIEQLGFDTVLLEAPSERCELLARYVAGEDVDGRAALRDVFYWCWQNEEMLAAITMLREWNLTQRASGSAQRVRFDGFDVFPPRRARERAQQLLDRLDPRVGDEFRSLASAAAALPQWTDRDPAWERVTGALSAFCEGLPERLKRLPEAEQAVIAKACESCRNLSAALA
jgi:erythromycin esterase-like protein